MCAVTLGGLHQMTQSNEQTFFNENGIYISQFRFVTPNGQTYPTRTIQSTYMLTSRPWGCLSQIVITVLAILGIVAVLLLLGGMTTLVASYAFQEFATIGVLPLSWVVVILSAAVIVVVILGWKTTLSRRRRRWTANFMFAGGGDFSTVGGGGVSTGGAISISSSTTRRPDYSVWSYDRQWTERLVAAANEAIVAAQQS